MNLNLKAESDQFSFMQVIENEYVTTVCLPWWDADEDYMRFSFNFLNFFFVLFDGLNVLQNSKF